MKYRVLAIALAAASVAGSAAAQDLSSEKGKVSYYLGYDLAARIVEVGETVDANAVLKGVNDAIAKKAPAIPEDQMKTALQAYDARVQARAKAEFEKVAASNAAESTKFLAANKAKAGVQTLPNGLQYRVITAGKGAKPTTASAVNIKVAGPFPYGQRPQDAQALAAKPADGLKISDIPLAGLRQALTMMPTGSKWEITLPPALGSGKESRMPNAVLQYEVELVSFK